MFSRISLLRLAKTKYKPDGASYCCEEMLTGKFVNGRHYTITFNNGPVVP